MKILQIAFNLMPGGAERFVVDLSNELAKTNDVTLLILKEDKSNPDATFYKPDLSDDVRYVNLGLPQKYSPKGLWKVYRYIKALKPDVVHMHDGGMPKFCGLANLLLGKKITFVMTIHSDMHNGYKNFYFDVIHNILGRSNRLRFAALSETNYSDLRKLYPHSPATCITNGRSKVKPTELFDEVADEIKGYKKNNDTTVVVHVARFNQAKNQQLLVDGFNKVIADGYNATLLIIGRGFDSEDGIRLQNSACDSIHFLGLKRNVGDYLLNADVFTLSSISEGMPITLLEAMLCGIPMVSTPVCGAVDVINGKNGILSKDFSLDEYVKAMESMLDNLDSFKANAKNSAQDSIYTIEACARKYLDFYSAKASDLKKNSLPKN